MTDTTATYACIVVLYNSDVWGIPADEMTEGAHAAACDRATEWLTDNEGDALSILVRPTRHGETDGVYREDRYGRLSTRLPFTEEDGDPTAAIHELIGKAWQHACETFAE